MTQINSAWHDKKETKIGDYGEALIKKYLEDLKFICYKPVTDGSHLFDFLIYREDKSPIAVEVKTKPSRNKYPDTGFDYRHYLRYKRYTEETNTRMIIYFVDSIKGEIYGNYLDELDKPRRSQNISYPRDEYIGGREIRYFPLEAMKKIRDLTDNEKFELQRLHKLAC